MTELSTDNLDNRGLAHKCVMGREYGQNTARSHFDQATAKLVGQRGLTTDELYVLMLFIRHFKYLFSSVGE